MDAMRQSDEKLTGKDLDAVVAFVRDANPFAQKTWGWDTGRFMDWRWGSNTLAETASPGWFAEQCRVYRVDGEIRAVSVAEYGGESECIITRDEDPGFVAEVRDLLIERHVAGGSGLRFEFSEAAQWLRSLFGEAGLVEEPGTGNEWEYDLRERPGRTELPGGFTIESLGDERPGDLEGIAACIQRAFDSENDVLSALRSLQSNPMYRPELSVFARSPEGRIAAYCRGTVDPDNGVCGIDPVCTDPDFQRMGLSKAVVETCFETQRQLGGRFSYIGSAPEPAPGTYLYRSLGPSNRTVMCEWSLT